MEAIPNPFTLLYSKMEELTAEVHALRKAIKQEPQRDEIGGLDLAVEVTGLAKRTLYKMTHRRTIPHRRVGGRLYFRRSELEAWIDLGRRPTAAEMATTVMTGRKM